jgi:hypothetical protein
MHLHEEPPQFLEGIEHRGIERRKTCDVLLRGRPDVSQVVRKAETIDDPLVAGLEHRMVEPFQRRAGQVLLAMQNELEHAGERHLDRRSAQLGIALRCVRVADREQRAFDRHRVVHRRTLADPPVVDVAAGVTRRNRADEVFLARSDAHRSEVRSGRDADALEIGCALHHGLVIDNHSRIIHFRMQHAVGIDLRRQHIAVQRRCPVFAACRVDLEHRDDLTWLGLFD